MPQYEHLNLVRLPERLARRKRPGFGSAPGRDPSTHASKLSGELDTAVETQRKRRKPEFVDPALILRVQMTGSFLEEDWEQLGLTVVSSDRDQTLVLFSSSDDMQEFRARLQAYQGGARPERKAAPYNSFISSIEKIGTVEPKDRIGIRFREEGFAELSDFDENAEYVVDLELWDVGRRSLREKKLSEISQYVEGRNGEIFDQYIGPSISMLRIKSTGALLRTLLAVEEIALIDLPPEPDIETGEALSLTLDQVPPLSGIPDDAPVIGIIDSGVNDHPFFQDIIAGAIGVPDTLGTADDWGHGTRVSGVAIFGDIRTQLNSEMLSRSARLCSAKVVNDQGKFDDRRLVPSQMREAITTLNERFGCRIFVVALGDTKRPYKGGKIGTWAATLDELARELDILIVVSSGNRSPRGGNRLEQAVTEYPGYLLEENNGFLEPAGAMNVLTVGALSHGEGIDDSVAEHVYVRPITREDEPSPFSRVGPGIGGAIKPDLVDVGGTLVFDPMVARLRPGDELPSAGVLTLSHKFIDSLFTARSGTSYAAPRVAFGAAQILTRFPTASANLLRALLVGSAEVPDAAYEKLSPVSSDAVLRVCGHGRFDLERAAFSDDARVVLYAEDELEIDHFAVYQLPIPEPFQGAGSRAVRVTLAYDPPVRHTRTDYAGTGMSFRLIRGCDPDQIFEHFRQRPKGEEIPEIAPRFQCALEPKPTVREKGTVQCASKTFKRSIEQYGNDYYLVVRCEGGWAGEIGPQSYAIVVELSHQSEIRLYEQIRQRVQV